MLALLSRIAARNDIGVSLGEREIAVSKVARTPFGQVETARARIEIGPDGLAPAIERLFSRQFTRKELARARVAVGLPVLRVFFSTRPIHAENREESPEILLHEVLQSPTLNIDDMAVDLIKLKPGRRQLASIMACRKKYLSSVLSALDAAGVSPTRAEASACALLRDAARRIRPPGKSRAAIRILLGADQGLAVLMAPGEMPLMWRPFDLSAGEEAVAIRAAVASLSSVGRYCGLDEAVDCVLIHGRPDLGPLSEAVDEPHLRGLRVLRHDHPAIDDADAALGLAQGPGQGAASFNLARTLGRAPSFLDIFPWGQAALQAAVLTIASLFVGAKLGEAQAAAARARAEDARFAWARAIPSEKLAAEKKELDGRVDAIRKFLDTRILWTAYAHDVSAKLPPEISLTSFHAQAEIDATGGKGGARSKKSLAMRLQAPIPKTGAMPKEIDAFLRALRDDPLLRRDFPEIEMADLRWSSTSGRPMASFNVNCAPGASARPAAAARKSGH